MTRHRSARTLVLALLAAGIWSAAASAATLPTGFSETPVLSGLANPTAIRWAPDGRIFVAEKRGVVRVFDGPGDTTPTTFADLRTNVHNFWDRGLLGLAVDPGFPARPYVYVLYTYDAAIGGTAPRWGTPGADSDPCPTPPGPTADGCVVSGRLSRLTAAGDTMTGPEQVLINDWCQQYPSHSIGSLAFGSDGALYVTGGDGASFTFVDYGQDGLPVNPCGDPGQTLLGMSPPGAEGGALRSQDLRTSGDPVSLDGALLRVNPDTGAAAVGNPVAGQRIVAYGMRNPFRMATRPGTGEVWIGDVGWGDWEEIQRVVSTTDGIVENFGWPCYEGSARQDGYDAANLSICETLYAAGSGAHALPYHAYHHAARVVTGETCPTGSSSISGLAFTPAGSPYPPEYAGALFFTDFSRDCIWVMRTGSTGRPEPATLQTFVAGASNPVELQFGPDGRLYYPDFEGGRIMRVDYASPTTNRPPTALATASPTSGTEPLVVSFDGSGSSDPDPGDTLAFAWDLDDDGAFDDSTAVRPTHTYTLPGTFTPSLRVTDPAGATAVDEVTVTVGNTPPEPTIAAPAATTTWAVGDTITFSGSASDAQDGALPASALSWTLLLHHCPSNCHTHPIQTFAGASGSFVAPDHDHPSHLELQLKATDSGGLEATRSVTLNPRTVRLTFQSSPGGMQLTVGGTTSSTSFTRTLIEGSKVSVSAPSPQTRGGGTYSFVSWSDGGAQTHDVVATTSTTLSARFRKR